MHRKLHPPVQARCRLPISTPNNSGLTNARRRPSHKQKSCGVPNNKKHDSVACLFGNYILHPVLICRRPVVACSHLGEAPVVELRDVSSPIDYGQPYLQVALNYHYNLSQYLGRLELGQEGFNGISQLFWCRQERAVRRVHLLYDPRHMGCLDHASHVRNWDRLVLQANNEASAAVKVSFLPTRYYRNRVNQRRERVESKRLDGLLSKRGLHVGVENLAWFNSDCLSSLKL